MQKIHYTLKLPPIPLSLASAAWLIISINTDVIKLEKASSISYYLYQRKASSLLTEYRNKEEEEGKKGKKKKEKYLIKNCMQKYTRYNNLIKHIRDLKGLGHLYTKSIINKKAYN